MARGAFPSMTALLGLLAVAGYQNRDALSGMLGNRGGAGGQGGGLGGMLGNALGGGGMGGGMSGQGGQGGGLGGMPGNALGGGGMGGGMGGQGRPAGLDSLLGRLGGGAAGGGAGGLGGLLGGGLGELDQRFRQNGHAETVDSWVGTGPNREVAPHDLEQAIGPDVLEDLMEHTGLSRDELLARLSRELPHAVDQYTPQGRIPGRDDFA